MLCKINTYIKITEKIHWIMVGLHINEICFVQLIHISKLLRRYTGLWWVYIQMRYALYN